MLEQLPRGQAFIWNYNQWEVQFKSSYGWVKAHLCAMSGHGIRICGGKNKKGLSKEQIMEFSREKKEADAMSERAKQKSLPFT